jgi:N utilization substance protein B
MPVRKRSQARMLALQALCLFDAIGDEFADRLDEFLCDQQAYEDLGFAVPPAAKVLDFARRLASGTWERRSEYDRLLDLHAAHWSIARMLPVDRNILRMGLHELHEHDAGRPPRVVINEAVELARCFGDAGSPAFVNGVLDGIRRAIEKGGQSGLRADASEAEEPKED